MSQEDIYEIVLSHFPDASKQVVEEIRTDIKALMLDLIGEDETLENYTSKGWGWRNELKAELRKKVSNL